MRDGQLFLDVARQQGFAPDAAAAALGAVAARLEMSGLLARRYFCFRGGGADGAGDGSGAQPPARPRLLLLFRSPDDAVGFAQARGLGRSPRLMALALEQALVTLLQRPAIGALLVATGGEGSAQLPPGVRITRDELLAMLATQDA